MRTVSRLTAPTVQNTVLGLWWSRIYPNKGGAIIPATLKPVETKPNTFPISVAGASERISMSREGETTPEKNPAITNKDAIVPSRIEKPATAKNTIAMATKQRAANR